MLETRMTSPSSFETIKSFPHGTQQINEKICVILKVLECTLEVSFKNIITVFLSTIFACHQFFNFIFDNCTNVFCRIHIRTVTRPNRIAPEIHAFIFQKMLCCISFHAGCLIVKKYDFVFIKHIDWVAQSSLICTCRYACIVSFYFFFLFLLFIVNYECVIALTDAVFYGLQFGIKFLVKSFGLKIEPGGVKVLNHPARLTMDKLEILLSLLPSITYLDLTSSGRSYKFVRRLSQWEGFIRSKLPKLYQLEFFIFCYWPNWENFQLLIAHFEHHSGWKKNDGL